jgi:hypothetical protein
MSKSRFIFKPHKHAADEHRTVALVDVYDRETSAHLGMLNPTADGAYILRDRTGERLSVHYSGRFDDMVYLSRETSASILRQRMMTVDKIIERRATSVSAGCPNNWHNTSDHRADIACPDCPTQLGLKFAVHLLETLGYREAEIARLRCEIYTPKEVAAS